MLLFRRTLTHWDTIHCLVPWPKIEMFCSRIDVLNWLREAGYCTTLNPTNTTGGSLSSLDGRNGALAKARLNDTTTQCWRWERKRAYSCYESRFRRSSQHSGHISPLRQYRSNGVSVPVSCVVDRVLSSISRTTRCCYRRARQLFD